MRMAGKGRPGITVAVAVLAVTAGLAGAGLASPPAAARVVRLPGSASRPSAAVAGKPSPALANGLATTPYMGWNTYYGQVAVTQSTILALGQSEWDSHQRRRTERIRLDGHHLRGGRQRPGPVVRQPR